MLFKSMYFLLFNTSFLRSDLLASVNLLQQVWIYSFNHMIRVREQLGVIDHPWVVTQKKVVCTANISV